MTTTTDTAREVIERHLDEWRGKLDNHRNGMDSAAGSFDGSRLSGGVDALQGVVDDLPTDDTTQQPVSDATTFSPTTNEASAWDGERDAFDPLRAGFDDDGNRGYLHSNGPHSFVFQGFGGSRWGLGVKYTWEGGSTFSQIYIPANLPHNIVVSILRANGYEGGDDAE